MFVFFAVLGNQVVVHPILEKLVLRVFEHHVESVFDIVLSSSRHVFDYFGPLIADLQLLFQDEDVLLGRKGHLLDVWVEEVHPPLSALLAVTFDTAQLHDITVVLSLTLNLNKIFIEDNCDLIPMFRAVSCNYLDQLIVFYLTPNTLLNTFSPVQIISIETLAIITAWDEARYLHPISLLHLVYL